ncbi:ferrous iron transport protein B [Candidatus Omnitrophota bacterium]
MAKKKITIALAGNPNSGKTTVFNNITGFHQRVGNYPGVTVEKKEGILDYKDYQIRIVDLPGTYSLSAYSIDEVIARNFVIEEKPDVVINVIDTSNIERNLYLATHFIELGVPLVLAFNMHDVAQKQGLAIDKDGLAKLLGAPIIFTVASKNRGMNELFDEAINLVEGRTQFEGTTLTYGQEIQEELRKIESVVVLDKCLIEKYPSQWLAIKLLENDSEVKKQIEKSSYAKEIQDQAEGSTRHLQSILGDTPEALIADRRYGFISGACSEAVRKTFEERHNISDMIDNVLVNKVVGLPIFLGVMWLLFKFTFTLSQPLMTLIERGQQWLGGFVGSLLPQGSLINALVVDAVIGGVGSVLVFVPVIFLLFFAMAILEDSGYLARAAFIMDRFMHKLGLHGRSFIPMLLGFGCNVPAIMATRVIEDRKDRLVTILINPFMSCGARLPVYILFIGAFFPEHLAGNVLFSLYLIGIVIAMIMAVVLRKFFLRGEAAHFVMELPPYRMPTFKGLLVHMWERGSHYLKKAGTIIFAACVVMWLLSNFPMNQKFSKDYDMLITQAQGNSEVIIQLENQKHAERLENSYAGSLGKAIAPLFKPLGFDDWKIAVGLVGGVAAKEIMIGTLGTLHSVGEVREESEALRGALRDTKRSDGTKLFTPLVAYALMVFVLLYIPCLATIAVIRQETHSWGWPLFTIFYTVVVAWGAAFIVYQGGKLFGLGV